VVDELGIRDEKLGFLGEELIVEKIIGKYISKQLPGEYLGFPDDARDILPMAPKILFNIDGYSLLNAKLPWRDWRDVGYTAITGAISDHIVKGGIPRDIMVSIGLSRNMNALVLEEIYKGIGDALREYNLRLLGGDTNSSSDPWITVSVLGYTTAKKPPRRDGAKPGDIVITTGYYGAMGVVALLGFDKASQYKWVVEATRRPKIYIELAFVISNYYRGIHASIDVSDGLGYSLLEICRRSGVGMELFDKPLYYDGLKELCDEEDMCLWKYILNGGEEYGAVLVIDNRIIDKIKDYLAKFQIPYKIIGKVIEGKGISIKGERISVLRWDQFRGWVTQQY
jgi:thiamine-monophosphate kinase